MAAAETLDLIQTSRQATALLHPLRLQILEALRNDGSASSVAERLGLPRQRVNYHLRELEKAGLLQLVEERRKGNCIERVFRSGAHHYLIAPQVLGRLAADPEEIRDRFSSTYLIAVAARAIRDLGPLRARADQAGKRLATLTLQSDVAFASPADRNAFAEELASEVARLVAKYHDDTGPDARRFKLFLGAYPETSQTTDSTPRPEEIDQ